jgi:hypothetical protein
VWVLVTVLTAPTDHERLIAFYRHIRPAGPGWRPIQTAAGVGPSADNLPQAFLAWMLGVAFVYAALFGTGSYLYGRTPQAALWLVVFIATGTGLVRLLPGMWEKAEK